MGRIALLLTFAAAPLAGLTDAEVARLAEREFQRGIELRGARDKAIPHFQIAYGDFDELRQRGVCNPDLFRNMGNAALLADDLPRAVLSYRRGLRLAPADPDLQAGMNEARSRVAYATTGGFGRPPEERRPPWPSHLGPARLLLGAFACYAACCFCITRWLMTRRLASIAFAVVALSLTAALTTLAVLRLLSEPEASELPLAVIAEDGVLLRKGDGMAYPVRYDAPLNKGVEARRLYERGEWSQIELSGGEVGWMRSDWLLMDEP